MRFEFVEQNVLDKTNVTKNQDSLVQHNVQISELQSYVYEEVRKWLKEAMGFKLILNFLF